MKNEGNKNLEGNNETQKQQLLSNNFYRQTNNHENEHYHPVSLLLFL